MISKVSRQIFVSLSFYLSFDSSESDLFLRAYTAFSGFRLTRTKEEFIKIMSELNLGPPKQLERSLRMNIKCGIDD